MTRSDELKPCPFCATLMHEHEHCFSHPKPSGEDCILRHYSFGNEKAGAWNARSNDTIEDEPSEAMIEAGIDAWQRVVEAMEAREQSDKPEDLPDYDEGDVCRAIYKAMRAAITPE